MFILTNKEYFQLTITTRVNGMKPMLKTTPNHTGTVSLHFKQTMQLSFVFKCKVCGKTKNKKNDFNAHIYFSATVHDITSHLKRE